MAEAGCGGTNCTKAPALSAEHTVGAGTVAVDNEVLASIAVLLLKRVKEENSRGPSCAVTSAREKTCFLCAVGAHCGETDREIAPVLRTRSAGKNLQGTVRLGCEVGWRVLFGAGETDLEDDCISADK